MTTIIVNHDYTILNVEVLTFTNETGFFLDGSAGQPTPDITNNGHVTVVATANNPGGGGGLSGIQVGGGAFFDESLIWNRPGAEFTVISNTPNVGANGITSVSWSADFTNDGVFGVSALGEARGISTSDSTFVFTNTGAFNVAGSSAWGLALPNGGSIINSGQMLVNGSTGSTFGVNSSGFAFSFQNSGVLKVHDTTTTSTSYGVQLSGYSNTTISFTNSGLIEADVAIALYLQSGGFSVPTRTITNLAGGQIVGDIENSGFNLQLNNAGTITGNVRMGAADDTYNGANGVLNGVVYGGLGNNTITTGAGNDVIYGTTGQSSGQDGNNTLSGGGGDDHIYGGRGADQISGGQGDDFIVADYGSNTIDGGSGSDTLSYTFALSAATVSLAIASAQATTSASTDTLISIENLVGSNFNDMLTGDIGDNRLEGGGGDDRLDGGAGMDVASYASAGAGVTVALVVAGAQDTHGAGIDTLVSIENLTGSAFNDFLTGDGATNVLVGLAGDDSLNGLGGADLLYGGLGDDTYVVDTQADLAFENPGEGTDGVIATAGFYLYANIENLRLGTGAGAIFGVGNDLANTMIGNEGDNLLIGWGGNDLINGGAGNDTLFGVDGDDIITGGSGIDYLVGGAGNDDLDGGDQADALYGEDGDDALWGGTSFDTDIMVGGAGNDILHGDSGAGDYDLMDGGAGNDTYYVDTPADLTFEALGGGTDTVIADIDGGGYYLYANVENLTLAGATPYGVGNELDNVITGNAIGTFLLGGAGNDTLNGKAGNDVLFGEAGADTFVFERGTGGDVIGDFTVGTDKIEIDGIYSSFAELQGHMVENGGTTAVDLGLGDLIVINGVAKASLTAGDFVFKASAQGQGRVNGMVAEDALAGFGPVGELTALQEPALEVLGIAGFEPVVHEALIH